jgi:hypothetical protein
LPPWTVIDEQQDAVSVRHESAVGIEGMHPLSAGRSPDVIHHGFGIKENPVSAVTYLESYVRLFIDARKSEPLIESTDGAQEVSAK